MDDDARFMQRCLDLAILGLGKVSPNPLVGCVIVCDGKIIGEGYHKNYGGPHAEANAIHAVQDKSLLPRATLFVNLEPCAHYGKTPPCADLILTQGIPRVIIGTSDPYPSVAGAGIERLQKGGVEVHTGMLAPSCRILNRRFFSFHEKKRPFIILKWAQSADGMLAPEKYHAADRDSYWITGKTSLHLVHKWRTEEDAILVGWKTVLTDNPQLTAREWPGKNPVRLILDPENSLGSDHAVFDQQAPTLVYNCHRSGSNNNLVHVRVDCENFLSGVLQDALKREIQSILVEGGAFTLGQFIERGIWDEARVFTGERTFGQGVVAPRISSRPVEHRTLGKDRLEIWYNRDNTLPL